MKSRLANINKVGAAVSLAFGIGFFYLFNRMAGYLVEPVEGRDLSAAIVGLTTEFPSQLQTDPFRISLEPLALLVGAAIFLFMTGAMFSRMFSVPKEDRKGEQHGSARKLAPKELKGFANDDPNAKTTFVRNGKKFTTDANQILSENIRMRYQGYNKDNRYHRNNNVLYLGASGTLKSRSSVVPNLLQLDGSVVITDPKLELYKNLSPMYRAAGYRVVLFNAAQKMLNTDPFNPFAEFDDVNDLMTVVEDFFATTTGEDEKSDWFAKAERNVFSSVLAAMVLTLPPADRTMDTLIKIMRLIKSPPEGVANYTMPYETFLRERFGDEYEESLATEYFEGFLAALPSPRTAASIVSSIQVRLAPFKTPSVRRALRSDGIRMNMLDKEKTALFVATEDSSSTYEFITKLFYRTLIRTFQDIARESDQGRLGIPVHFMMDEFANIGKIPDFDRLIAVGRSKGMSFSIVLQNIGMLRKHYSEQDEEIIFQNCDSIVFLGGQDPKTNELLEKVIGKETIKERNQSLSINSSSSESTNLQSQQLGRSLWTADELGRLDNRKCIVKIRGMNGCEDFKYDMKNHPNFKHTGFYDASKLASVEGYGETESMAVPSKMYVVD